MSITESYGELERGAINATSGGVIWLTGYSSAGKTTLARHVVAELGKEGAQAVFLDGDDLRGIFGHKWGYSDDERRELTLIYLRLCSHIASQGRTVVISAVAMYADAFAWFRQNVPRGMLVYLDVPESVRRGRDDAAAKGVYTDSQVARYDEPTDPDLRLENPDGADLVALARQVLAEYDEVGRRRTDRGKTAHWDTFYAECKPPQDPSSFARYVAEELLVDRPGASLLEVGCGNGRDAAYFDSEGLDVTAIDRSSSAITLCKETHPGSGARFQAGSIDDVISDDESFKVVYSRFVLHAMTLDEEERFLADAARALEPDGLLLIECRSINDPLARKGEVLSATERIHGHYRRFIIADELSERVSSLGLRVESMVESNGLAKFPGDDPVVVRLVARKA